MDKRKVYISHSSDYDYVNQLYNPLKNINLEDVQFIFPHDDEVINSKEIIGKCFLMIAEVSLPSVGQGIEIGWADYSGVPILCIYREGVKVSTSLKFVTDDFIVYNNVNDMVDKINSYLLK